MRVAHQGALQQHFERGLVGERPVHQVGAVELLGIAHQGRHHAPQVADALGDLEGVVAVVGEVDVALDGQGQLVRVLALGAEALGDARATGLERLEPAPTDADEGGVAAARHPPHGGRIGAGDEDLGHRLLDRTHGDRRLGQREVLAPVGHPAGRQALLDDVPDLEHALDLVVEVEAEALELVALIARAQADHRPALAQVVQEGDLLGEANRVVERRHDDRGAEPDALGDRREVGGHHQRRGADAVVGEVVLGEPGHVEAHVVGEAHHVGGVAHDLERGLTALAHGHQIEQSELHRALVLDRVGGAPAGGRPP